MQEIAETDWEAVQSDIDTCKVCCSESLFAQVNPPPGRPCNPGHRGRLLFISGAPAGMMKTVSCCQLELILFLFHIAL